MKRLVQFLALGSVWAAVALVTEAPQALSSAGAETPFEAAELATPGTCYKDFFCQAQMGTVPSLGACASIGGNSFRAEGGGTCERLQARVK